MSYAKGMQINQLATFYKANRLRVKIAAGLAAFSVIACLADASNKQSLRSVAVANSTPSFQVTAASYRCEIDGTFYAVKNKAVCDKKIADTWKNFDPHAFAEDYKNALDVLEYQTRPKN